MVGDFVIRALDHLVLVHLPGALEAERVTAWQRNRFLVIVIVWLETDAAFKYLIHLLFCSVQL